MTEKKDPLDELVDEAAREAFGRSRSEAKAKLICVSCGKPPEAFRDKSSEREWEISRLCQKCQDNFFGEE
jgi:hypothetical protein